MRFMDENFELDNEIVKKIKIEGSAFECKIDPKVL